MKNNNIRIELFSVKQVVFGISLSVIKVLFSLTDYSLSCSFSVRSPDRLARILIINSNVLSINIFKCFKYFSVRSNLNSSFIICVSVMR